MSVKRLERVGARDLCAFHIDLFVENAWCDVAWVHPRASKNRWRFANATTREMSALVSASHLSTKDVCCRLRGDVRCLQFVNFCAQAQNTMLPAETTSYALQVGEDSGSRAATCVHYGGVVRTILPGSEQLVGLRGQPVMPKPMLVWLQRREQNAIRKVSSPMHPSS